MNPTCPRYRAHGPMQFEGGDLSCWSCGFRLVDAVERLTALEREAACTHHWLLDERGEARCLKCGKPRLFAASKPKAAIH